MKFLRLLPLAFVALPLTAQPITDYDLYLLDTRTDVTSRLTSIAGMGEFNPSISNDGRSVVHDVVSTTGQDLWITSVATGTSTPLTGGEGGNDADWAPNGRLIAFDRYPGDPSVYTLSPAGGTPTLVVTDARDPSWSGNSQRIVFQRVSDGSVRTVRADGTGETTVAPFGINPAWSPNNQYIAYSDESTLYCVRVGPDGVPDAPPQALTSGAFLDQQPAWADARTIVFHRGGPPSFDFDLYTVDCGRSATPTRLTGVVGGDFDPSARTHTVVYASTSAPAASGSAARAPQTTVTAGPNPLRTSTTIRFEVADEAPTTVEVLDVTGRRVALLLDRALPPGTHRTTWEAGDAAEGLYLVRIRSGTRVETRRLVLLR